MPFGKALDCISQRSSRDARVILCEEVQHCELGPLTGFAQHPADGFVDQVVLVFQQEGGDAKCIFEVASLMNAAVATIAIRRSQTFEDLARR